MMNVCVGAQVEASTCCVETLREQFDGVEWVLGNHTDELTPWVPVITRHLAEIQLKQEEEEQEEDEEEKEVLQGDGGGVEAAGGATSGASAAAGGSAGAGAAGRKAGRAMVERARAALRHAGVADTPPLQPSPAPSLSSSSLSTRRRQRQRQRPPRYWVLPCCLWDIGPGGAAAKFIGHDPTLGRYHTYLGHIEEIGLALGYDVVRDTMRIPSTRNICLVGSAPTTAAEASRTRRGGEAAKAKQVVKKGGARRVRRPAAAEEGGGGAPAALFA